MNKAIFLGLVSISLLAAGHAQAQATRTWISGVGDDVNPCSRTAPCKTFAGAISKTAAGGEIDVLDPGGFGAVTITKSITLDDFSRTSVRASEASGNSDSGFVVLGAAGAATMNVFNSSAASNINSGVVSGGMSSTSSQIRLSNVSISSNGAGMTAGLNGTIVSFGNNYSAGSGAPTAHIAPQ